jgi:hypothetical protein
MGEASPKRAASISTHKGRFISFETMRRACDVLGNKISAKLLFAHEENDTQTTEPDDDLRYLDLYHRRYCCGGLPDRVYAGRDDRVNPCRVVGGRVDRH